MLRYLAICALAMQSTLAFGQPVDLLLLEEMRKRYKNSFESIYVTDSALNNLFVHLRARDAQDKLTKLGTNADVLNVLVKFLADIANDRAFLQLELRVLKAGYKKQSDPSATIQQLPWKEGQVFHVAVLCDRYLQGQLKLAALKKQLASSGITVGESWSKFDELRVDPYVPAVTMVETLADFVSYTDRRGPEVTALATTNPYAYNGIINFKLNAKDEKAPIRTYFATDWPTAIKSQWIKRYKILESYAKSTDENSAVKWEAQLDGLQRLEYAKLFRAIEAEKPQ